MRETCIHCGQATGSPISGVERYGKTVANGPLCKRCWTEISRSIDDDICTDANLAEPTPETLEIFSARFEKKI
jgi:hypothetical protein